MTLLTMAPATTVGATVTAASSTVTYKEYWIPHTEFDGGCDSPPLPQGYYYFEPGQCAFDLNLSIPDDMSQALKAEVYLDLWRNRDVPKIQFRINGNGKHTPDVGYDWSRTPWVGAVPLTELRQGTNTFRFTSLFPVHVHDVMVRVYYDATHPLLPGAGSDVTPPTGALTGITADNGTVLPNTGGLLDVTSNNLSLSATASDDRGVRFVQFIGKYDGYDIDADGITNEWQATYRNNWNPGGTERIQSRSGLINHLGTDGTAPYSVNANVGQITNQSGVQFKIRVVDMSGNVIEAPLGPSAPFDLVRDYQVESYRIPNFDDSFISGQDPEFPLTVSDSIDLPNLDGVTKAFVLGNYWRNPRLSINNNASFRVFETGEDEWVLSKREIPVSSIGAGLNSLVWTADQGFGHFIERPGPMIVLYRDTGPPAAPTITTAPVDVAVSANLLGLVHRGGLRVTATGVSVAGRHGRWLCRHRWRDGGDIFVASGFTHNAWGSISGRATNRFGSVTSSPAVLTVTPQPGWAAGMTQWPYRFEVLVGANGYQRTERYARVGINFTQLLNSIGVSAETVTNPNAAAFDPQSVRVIEVDGSGAPIGGVLGYQWDQVTTYNAVTNADGNVVFPLVGTTAANQTRRFHVYFATKIVGIAPLPQTNTIALIDNVLDEGQLSYRVETPRATYMFQKDAGGFSSILDTQNNDWLSFDDDVFGPGGTFRGIPNAVTPEGSLHPGATDSKTVVLANGPLSTTLQTTTLDGRFGMRWEIYPTYTTAIVTKALAQYWFLYEGTPGGSFSGSNDRVVRAPGISTPASVEWSDDLPGREWTYFSDTGLQRSLAMIHHNADNLVDSYKAQDSKMTVFGFGRSQTTPLLGTAICSRCRSSTGSTKRRRSRTSTTCRRTSRSRRGSSNVRPARRHQARRRRSMQPPATPARRSSGLLQSIGGAVIDRYECRWNRPSSRRSPCLATSPRPP